MLDRLPIGIKVFLAPAIIIALMLCVMLVSELAVRRQQAAFLQVVGGSLTTSTATTRLLLAVADVQSEILRYLQLRQRLAAGETVLVDLSRSVISKYQLVDRLFLTIKMQVARPIERHFKHHGFLNYPSRRLPLKIVDGAPVTNMTTSTLSAHYQQLQSYIVELATRSLIRADSEKETEKFYSKLLLLSAWRTDSYHGRLIFLTIYVGRAISKPITNTSSVMSSIAVG